MALVKWSQSFKNPQGILLKNAGVSVYLSGSNTAARVFDENNNLFETTPQIFTDNVGKVTLQLDDDDYSSAQLFDIFCKPDGSCIKDDIVSLKSIQIFNDVEGFRNFRNIFAQTTMPVEGMRINDLWFDTDNDNEPYVYNGTNWLSKRDGTIATAATTANWSAVVDDDTHKPEDDADRTATSDFVTVTYPADQSNVQDQIDCKIDSWFQSTDPSDNWEGIDARHAGDMWWNTDTKKLKRYSGTAWSDDIEDQKAIDAYANAATAQDTADSKRRVFTATPFTPYDVGDMWVGGPSGDIKRCIIATASGDYKASDWELASEYDKTSNHKAAGLDSPDTRDDNQDPSFYYAKGMGTYVEFKDRSKIGAPGSETYGQLQTIVPWSDSSGGRVVQKFYEGPDRYSRYSTSDTAWSAWTIIHDGADKTNTHIAAGVISQGDLATKNEADADVLHMHNGPAEANADKTGSHTAANVANQGDLATQNTVTADQVVTNTLSAIVADLGTITAGTVTGATINTSTDTERIELTVSDNKLKVYDTNANIVSQLGGTDNSSAIYAYIPSNCPDTAKPCVFFKSEHPDVNLLYVDENTTNVNDYSLDTTVAIETSHYAKQVVTIQDKSTDQGGGTTSTSMVYISSGNIYRTPLDINGYIGDNSSTKPVINISAPSDRRGILVDTDSDNQATLYLKQEGTSYLVNTNVGGCYCTKAGVWTDASSSGIKENFEDFEALNLVNNLPIKKYTYISERKETRDTLRNRYTKNYKINKALKMFKKTNAETLSKEELESASLEFTELQKMEKKFVEPRYQRELKRAVPKHISPMAEDFYEAFGLGNKDGISPKDLAGVALQAIKELSTQVVDLKTRIEELEKVNKEI